MYATYGLPSMYVLFGPLWRHMHENMLVRLLIVRLLAE